MLKHTIKLVVSDFFIDGLNPTGIKINEEYQLGLTLYQCNHCPLIFGMGQVLENKTISTVDKFRIKLKEREKNRLRGDQQE